MCKNPNDYQKDHQAGDSGQRCDQMAAYFDLNDKKNCSTTPRDPLDDNSTPKHIVDQMVQFGCCGGGQVQEGACGPTPSGSGHCSMTGCPNRSHACYTDHNDPCYQGCQDNCGTSNGGGGNSTNGEEACEGHQFDEAHCHNVGCCQWGDSEQQCFSSVGTGPCSNSHGAGGSDEDNRPFMKAQCIKGQATDIPVIKAEGGMDLVIPSNGYCMNQGSSSSIMLTCDGKVNLLFLDLLHKYV